MNVVANETAILHRQWLLQDILPEALNELKIQVERSLDILFNEAGQPDALPVSSLKDESIKGFITLEKLSITKAELLVQLPHYNQDNPTKVVMNTDNPYRLEQAQQGINYIALAAKRLQRLDTSAWSSKQAVTELLDSICRDIDRARLAFEHPNDAERFPYKVCQPKKFNPPLKEDLVVEFYIKDVYVVCNAIALEFRQGKNAASNVDTQNNYISYKDKYATIIHQSQVQTQSPMLTELKASLKAIRESCLHHLQLLLQIDA